MEREPSSASTADAPVSLDTDTSRHGAEEGTILLLRGRPVILDARVAVAFDVETREINQAASRNPNKFGQEHRFQLSEDERDFLISQGVMSKPGRGGSRALPFVYTQKGVARLATVLDTPQALVATDLMIDLFVEVYQQIASGRQVVSVSHPDRLLPDADTTTSIATIRSQLLKAIQDLLQTEISPRSKVTVGDELAEIAGGALSYVKAHLSAKGLENEKVAAETLLIVEKAREIRDRTRADLEKSAAETERIHLENFDKKLGIVERVWAMAEKFEPNKIVLLNRAFVKPALLLQAPAPLAIAGPSPDGSDDQ